LKRAVVEIDWYERLLTFIRFNCSTVVNVGKRQSGASKGLRQVQNWRNICSFLKRAVEIDWYERLQTFIR